MKRLAGIFLLCAAIGLSTGWDASNSQKSMKQLQELFEEIRESLAEGDTDGAFKSIGETKEFLEKHHEGATQGRGNKAIRNCLREIERLERRAAGGDVILNKRLEGSFANITRFFSIHLTALERRDVRS